MVDWDDTKWSSGEGWKHQSYKDKNKGMGWQPAEQWKGPGAANWEKKPFTRCQACGHGHRVYDDKLVEHGGICKCGKKLKECTQLLEEKWPAYLEEPFTIDGKQKGEGGAVEAPATQVHELSVEEELQKLEAKEAQQRKEAAKSEEEDTGAGMEVDGKQKDEGGAEEAPATQVQELSVEEELQKLEAKEAQQRKETAKPDADKL
jgi:hypothetical protein